MCAWGDGAPLPSTDSGVPGASASICPADRDKWRKLRCWERDQGEWTSEKCTNKLLVLLSVFKQCTNRLLVLSVFQTREQLLTEISRYQSRVADLESALKQQGLVTQFCSIKKNNATVAPPKKLKELCNTSRNCHHIKCYTVHGKTDSMQQTLHIRT